MNFESTYILYGNETLYPVLSQLNPALILTLILEETFQFPTNCTCCSNYLSVSKVIL